MPAQTFDEFMRRYNPDGQRAATEIDVSLGTGLSPFIIIRDGDRVAVINPMAFDDHLCIDVHSFVAGEDATAGVFGMTEGRRVHFPDTGTTSHGWASARLIAILIGEQGAGERGIVTGAARFTAHFTPEAWVNNQAIEVDVEGPREWDCSAWAQENQEYLDRLEVHSEPLDSLFGAVDNDDVFKDDPAAPAWVRDWRGPFTLRIRRLAQGE